MAKIANKTLVSKLSSATSVEDLNEINDSYELTEAQMELLEIRWEELENQIENEKTPIKGVSLFTLDSLDFDENEYEYISFEKFVNEKNLAEEVKTILERMKPSRRVSTIEKLKEINNAIDWSISLQGKAKNSDKSMYEKVFISYQMEAENYDLESESELYWRPISFKLRDDYVSKKELKSQQSEIRLSRTNRR